jgi:hypothetical protein
MKKESFVSLKASGIYEKFVMNEALQYQKDQLKEFN